MEVKRRKLEDKTLMNYFEKLPSKLFSEIFCYFNISELKLLCLVCKQWFQEIESDDGMALSKKIILNYEYLADNDIKDLSCSLRKFKNLLVVREDAGLEWFKKVKKVVSSSDLTHIELRHFNTHETAEILEAGKNTLTSVSILWAPTIEDDCKLPIHDIKFRKLRSLKIQTSDDYPVPIPFKFADIFKDLESFHIVISTDFEMNFLKNLITASQNTIRTLKICFDFYDCGELEEENDYDFEFVKGLGNLKALEFGSNYFQPMDSGMILSSLPIGLEVLKLKDVHIPEKILCSLHHRLPNLKELHVDSLHNTLESIFKYPVSEKIKSFAIKNLDLSLSDLEAIHESNNLKSFSIHISSDSESSQKLSILVSKFPAIETLSLMSSKLLNINFDLGVISGWTKLKSLSLVDFSLGFEKHLKGIYFPSLTHLTLRKCTHLDDFSKNVDLPKLIKLELDNCDWGEDNKSMECKIKLRLQFLEINHDKMENALDFIKRISVKSFFGKITLNDSRRYVNEAQQYKVWNDVAEGISNAFQVPFTRKSFRNTEANFCLQNNFIDLKVRFFTPDNWSGKIHL